MSQFDSYSMANYVENMRVFLRLKKSGFANEALLRAVPADGKQGRLPAYPKSSIEALEAKVNGKAARIDAIGTTLGERYCLARDYQGMSDAHVARELGVSRELARRWGANINRPTCICINRLATVLKVPVGWLTVGGEENLPASTHLGVRVGSEALRFREELYGMTGAFLASVSDKACESAVHRLIEGEVFSHNLMAKTARFAGGRWQLMHGALVFAPWIPIKAHGLSRRDWSDEVEGIIAQEIADNCSIYSAWRAIKRRCEASGQAFPKEITLHKRIEKASERVKRYGVDINNLIASACGNMT